MPHKKCRPVHRNLLWTLVGYHQLCSYPLCVFFYGRVAIKCKFGCREFSTTSSWTPASLKLFYFHSIRISFYVLFYHSDRNTHILPSHKNVPWKHSSDFHWPYLLKKWACSMKQLYIYFWKRVNRRLNKAFPDSQFLPVQLIFSESFTDDWSLMSETRKGFIELFFGCEIGILYKHGFPFIHFSISAHPLMP